MPAGALLVGALAGVGGCENKSGCVHTAIEVAPLQIRSQHQPMTLRATLTADGKPQPDFRLSFFLQFTGPTKLVGKSGQTDDLVGYAMTNASGVATYDLPRGPAFEGLPGERAVGYEVTLTTGDKINGKYYCDSKDSATFSG